MGRRHARPGIRDPRLQHHWRSRSRGDECRRRQRGVRRHGVAGAVGLCACGARMRRHQRLAEEPRVDRRVLFHRVADSYAARTGRPDNVGVIGVAFFRERPQPVAWKDAPKLERRKPRPRSRPRGRKPRAGDRRRRRRHRCDAQIVAARRVPRRCPRRPRRSAPATAATRTRTCADDAGSNARARRRTRRSRSNYDRRENLIAMGILPPPTIARSANPFPAWTPRFVPVPPPR